MAEADAVLMIATCRAGTKGWGKEFRGRPTAVWHGRTPEAAQSEKK